MTRPQRKIIVCTIEGEVLDTWVTDETEKAIRLAIEHKLSVYDSEEEYQEDNPEEPTL